MLKINKIQKILFYVTICIERKFCKDIYKVRQKVVNSLNLM